MSFRVGLFVYCRDRTIKVLSGRRARGSSLVELPLRRPVTPIQSYEVFSKESAIVKEMPNIKNECEGCGSRPVRLDCLISVATPLTNTPLTRLGGRKLVLLRGYQTTRRGHKC